MSVDRREFLAGLGGLGLGAGLGGVSHWFPLASPEVGPDWSPGREEFVPSTCMLCPSHCGIRGRLVDGQLVRIDGNPLHPVSRGGLCPKGYAGIQLLYHPGRLTGPVERVGPPSWDEALARVTATLAQLRTNRAGRSVAWLAGDAPGIMGELLSRFAKSYGTPHLLQENYDDGAAQVLNLSQGINAPPAFDLEEADLVLSFGAALAEAWWCLPQVARARESATGRRPRWIQADVRLSRTAAGADEWVPVRPGTYGALALGIAYVLLKEGIYDAESAGRQVVGLEDWTDESGVSIPGFRTLVLRHGRTEDVAERTGLPGTTIVRLAKTFGTASRPVALWDRSVSWRTGGLADSLAIHALNILVGALDRPGGVLVQPRLPVPSLDRDLPGASPLGRADELTAANWAGRVGAEVSSLDAMFLYYANPVASSPVPREVEAALERISLVVSFSPFLDETAKHADLVLPDHTYLERWQDGPAPASVPIPVWGVVQPLVPPLHDTRSTGDVVLSLAAGLGGDVAGAFPWTSVEEIVRERGRSLASARRGSTFVPPFRRGELRQIQDRGWWLPHGMSADEFWESIRSRGGWFDPFYDYHDLSAASQFPGGQVRLFSGDARREIALSSSTLVEGFLPLEQENGSTEGDEAYPLRLIPYPVLTLASGGTALMPWLLENLGVLTGDAWETWAEIHPGTGRELGLTSGKRVRIESEYGGFEAKLRFFDGAQPGVINVPYGLHTRVEGWGSPPGANPLRAIGDRRDPGSGLPDWYSSHVRVVQL